MNYTRKACMGERYLGCGISDQTLELDGIPGNDLGAYLNGGDIIVHGNTQDATGDTMNDGSITVYGNSGDALGYAMRGGSIYVQGYVGYRAGIHMKAYREKIPQVVIGGYTGSFLGEYQAGGRIIVLGIGLEDRPIVGDFCGTGMHGGKIYLRTVHLPADLPRQIAYRDAAKEDKAEIADAVRTFCEKFGGDPQKLLADHFF
ncbi:MAG: glutamate synthase, partial [Eubacteriales bacterium]